MSKKNRKRLLSVLLTAALIFTLALSSVMAQDEEHVRADKLSVGTEAVGDEETVGGFLDEEEVTPDEETEGTVSVDKINGAGSSVDDAAEETDADAADPIEEELASGIQTLSAADTADDEYGIQTLDYATQGDNDVCKIVDSDGDVVEDSGEQAYFSSISDAISAWGTTWDSSAESAKIVMTNDRTESLTIAEGVDVTLDLDGHTLTASSGRVITVNGTLVIDDSNTSGGDGGKITGGNLGDSGGKGAGVYVEEGASFTLNGGDITENVGRARYNSSSNYAYGGGVYVNGGTFTMTGGSISNNIVNRLSGANYGEGHGGGVYLNGGTFTMTGGSINNNQSRKNGSGVSVNGGATFTMSNAQIVDNVDNYGSGAGVDVIDGTFTMTNSTISGNSCTDYGGGVYVHDGSTFTLNSGTITGNTGNTNNGRQGGGVYVGSEATFNVYGGTVTENYNKSTLCNVYLSSGAYITLGATLTNSGGEEAEGLIGVTVTSTPKEDSPVQFTTAEESDTGFWSTTDLNYFFSDVGYSVSRNDEGYYLQFSDLTAEIFEKLYLSDDGGTTLYTEATADNYAQILSGASDWEALTDKVQVNEDLTNANSGTELTYPMLLEQAQAIADEVNAFEENYLMADSDGDLYTEATADNYAQILSGLSDWNSMSEEAQKAVNADLTAANDDETLTYEDLLAQAFQQAYLTDANGDGPYTVADADNYEQILSGAADWNLMSDDAKAAVNAALQEVSGDDSLTYDTLLTNAFEATYLSGDDGELYIEATAENYEQILAGKDTWDNMSDEAKAQVNADLTAAWQAAGHDGELTYEDLLGQAQAMEFEEKYLMADGDGDLYIEATPDNYEQILAGEADWEALSDEAKAQINADLTAAWQAAGNEGELTYPMLLEQAKALETANAFIYNYVSDNDVDNPYLEATVDNYQRILAGEDTWNAMSQAEQDAVNAILTAAWQAAGHDGELTYPMLLQWAKDLAAQLASGDMDDGMTDADGGVKTGDNTRLYLYLLLIAAAGAAASAAVAVSKRHV